MRHQRGLWAWGGGNGFTPWTDSHGHDVIALWSDAGQAGRENRQDAEPDEEPVFLSCERLIAGVPKWLAAGLPEAGLESEGGRFLYTIPLQELSDRAQAIISSPQE
jgi:hypothetical protein